MSALALTPKSSWIAKFHLVVHTLAVESTNVMQGIFALVVNEVTAASLEVEIGLYVLYLLLLKVDNHHVT